MKVSRIWLQKYFTDNLPASEEIADALTFHSSEVEEIKGDLLDVKILPDRAGYALSHRGVALETAASLGMTMTSDPLRESLPEFPSTEKLSVEVDDTYVLRHLGAIVRGVKVGTSPAWLKEALESVGQRSINNIVDATNYVMLNIGQPMHAFDLAKIAEDAEGGVTSISIRRAAAGEQVTVLTGETYTLTTNMFVIADATSGAALDIAGLKGGMASGITEATTDLLVSVGTYEGTAIRKMSQALKLWTDASLRYQNKISPELGAYGMRDILKLITDVAGGKVVGVVDVYPHPVAALPHVPATLERLNAILGTNFSIDDVTTALDRIALPYQVEGQTFTIMPTFERTDITTVQDIAEEIGRVLGYDRVTSEELPAMATVPDQRKFRGIERLKDILTQHGFTEISTQSFAAEGEIVLENPLQSDRPALRSSLVENMKDALTRAEFVAPLVLGTEPALKLFELGSVFKTSGEHLVLTLGYKQLTGKESLAVLPEAMQALADAFSSELPLPSTMHPNISELSLDGVNLEALSEGYEPVQIRLATYKQFSLYPFALRDVAVWTPSGTEESEVALTIAGAAGDLLVRMDLFDRFEKTDATTGTSRISYAFRMVFQSDSRTLADTDIDPAMAAITDALNAKDGWEVR
ncbi:MAG: Phenylalanine--tRNA ligase [Parcubacteria group bacterium]|nr:Phenylalanine--tRNA ligase [Parcubacteria group bacterium]